MARPARLLVYVIADANDRVMLDFTRGTEKAAKDAAANAADIPWSGLEAAGIKCRRARLKVGGDVPDGERGRAA